MVHHSRLCFSLPWTKQLRHLVHEANLLAMKSTNTIKLPNIIWTERQLLRVKVANLFEEQPGHLTTVIVSVKIYWSQCAQCADDRSRSRVKVWIIHSTWDRCKKCSGWSRMQSNLRRFGGPYESTWRRMGLQEKSTRSLARGINKLAPPQREHPRPAGPR